MSGRQGGKAKPLKQKKKGPKDLDEEDLAHQVIITNYSITRKGFLFGRARIGTFLTGDKKSGRAIHISGPDLLGLLPVRSTLILSYIL